MTIYIFTLFWVFFCSILSMDKKMKIMNKAFFLFILMMLIPLAGFRFNTGVDYESYLTHYKSVSDIFNYSKVYSSIEIGYEYIVSIFKTLNAPFYLLTIFMATATFFLFYHLSFHYSAYPTLSLLMFFSFAFWGQVMGQMRQPLAIFILYSFLFLLEKQKKWAFAFIVILTGLLFHKANFFFLLPLFFLNIKLKTKYYWTIFIASIIIGFLFLPIATSFLKILPANIPFKDSLVFYLTNNLNPILFTTGMIERFTLFAIVIYLCNKYDILKNTTNLLFYNMYFYSICLYFLFIHISSDLGARGSFCLMFAMFFLFPNILKNISNKKDYAIFLTIMLLWSVYMSIDIFSRKDDYIPYQSIF